MEREGNGARSVSGLKPRAIDSEIQEHLRGLDSKGLLDATDPRTGKQVLTHRDKADDITNAISGTMKLAPEPAAGAQWPGITATASCPFDWRGEQVPMLAPRPAVSGVDKPSWGLDMSSGKPSFRAAAARGAWGW